MPGVTDNGQLGTGLKQRLLSFFYHETLERNGGSVRKAWKALAGLYRRWNLLLDLKVDHPPSEQSGSIGERRARH